MEDNVANFLEHHGVKGQQWGVRRKERRAVRTAQKQREDEAWGKRGKERRANSKKYKGELKATNKKNLEAFNAAAKANPNFKREVKLTLKKKGISIDKLLDQEMTSGEAFTNKLSAKFRDSKGNKVSEDYANAVLTKAYSKQQFRERAALGGIYTAAILGGVLIGKSRFNSRIGR
jgi:hypothetical protein